MRNRRIFFASLTLSVAFLVIFVASIQHLQAQEDEAQADAGIKEQVDTLDKAIKEKRDRVQEINSLINKYKDRIEQQEKDQVSLSNEVLILDNRITTKQLTIEQAKSELEALRLEITALEGNIDQQSNRIAKQKDLAAHLIRRINQADRVPAYEVLVTKPSLSSFFNQIEETKRLENDLSDSLQHVKQIKQNLESNKQIRDQKRLSLESEKKKLKQEELALEAERNLKLSLAHETENKQEEFQRILYELQQQQQGTADDIAQLEDKLKDKLDAVDASLARGDVLLNWPVDPSRGITATFHDPTYPFRNLFEHPGTDVRASVGTPVRSAAGGYVAWNKTGRMYGNYTMVVHPGNIATVYAHLSKFIAKPDTYVERGDVIGNSGGMPGQPGAGLSTGPHLHFEVRQNGIPVNPENFLPSVDKDDE
jgi:murein DD-endopeptidase MepM/ murein hydrolase activator NlpD